MSKNILVLAPHPDDEVLGCGGTIALHLGKGDAVTVVFLTSGELGLKHLPAHEARATREDEARAAAKILGLTDLVFLRGSDWMLGDEITKTATLLSPVLTRAQPEIVYAPHPDDGHPDHQATLPVLTGALEIARTKTRPVVLCYEVWTPLQSWTHAENISNVMHQKLAALEAHASQVDAPKGADHKFDYIRAVTGLNQYRGAMIANADYAEAFLEITPGD